MKKEQFMLERRKFMALTLMAALSAATGRATAQTTDSEDIGGEVQCANLTYAVDKSSVCFSDRFMQRLQNETNINTGSSFQPVRLDNDNLYQYPFSIMTGEGAFTLTPQERVQLKYYVTHGGFLLASAGCSDPDWTSSFRSEIGRIFPSNKLATIPMSHPIFRTVYKIADIKTTHEERETKLEALTYQNHIVVVFSPDGLNDTADVAGDCCCCGGDEIGDAAMINVNILAYALLH